MGLWKTFFHVSLMCIDIYECVCLCVCAHAYKKLLFLVYSGNQNQKSRREINFSVYICHLCSFYHTNELFYKNRLIDLCQLQTMHQYINYILHKLHIYKLIGYLIFISVMYFIYIDITYVCTCKFVHVCKYILYKCSYTCMFILQRLNWIYM